MSFSLSHGKPLDVGCIGISDQELPPFDEGPVDIRRWFAPERSGQSLELEVGCGKGTFLLQVASQTPQVSYVGLEYAQAYWRYAADRCRRRGLENVRLVRAEAHFFIRNYVCDGCFRQVHIYFPDPWPKKRHHKRRLITVPYLRQLHRTLQSGGLVRIATDHAEYFDWIGEQASAVSQQFERLPFSRPQSVGEDELAGTNFERKYRREGRPLYGLVLRKT